MRIVKPQHDRYRPMTFPAFDSAHNNMAQPSRGIHPGFCVPDIQPGYKFKSAGCRVKPGFYMSVGPGSGS